MADLTKKQAIDAIADAEADILRCMKELLTCPEGGLLAAAVLNPNCTTIGSKTDDELLDITQKVNRIICAFACKEFAIADVIEALAENLALEKDLCKTNDCCCKCCCH